MADVIFYEKPGCINNTRQKKLLREAGHQVQEMNLLTFPWTAAKLRPFFYGMPIEEWFNSSAPKIKSGEVIPSHLEPETAISLMMLDPLLIRRPLMEVGEELMVGFDSDKVDDWIGLKPIAEKMDLESCPRNDTQHTCATTAEES